MKKRLSLFLILALLFLTSCTGNTPTNDSELTIACTTYPVYLLTQAVTNGVARTTVKLVVNQQVSCLHNYTLTMADMKVIEQSDLLIINGAGLENFLSDVLETRTYLDASHELNLIWNATENEYDPHIWLDPALASGMAQNIADGLSSIDKKNSKRYAANVTTIRTELVQFRQAMKQQLTSLPLRQLITFHDGFFYFARAFDLTIVASVEEEEGSEASARRIKELVRLIDRYHLPSVFVEQNGAASAANALAQECNISVYALDMGMSGDGTGLLSYEALIRYNVDTIREAYQ